MTATEKQAAQKRAAQMLADARIVVPQNILDDMEIVHFGLGEPEITGLQIIIYVNNDRYCAKELVMFPGQTCPEHRHPDGADYTGKRETFYVRFGEVSLFVPGKPAAKPSVAPPAAPAGSYTVFHEIKLNAGDQHTIEPDTLHWFKAGPRGAIVSEFSSTSRDGTDIFSDPRVKRV
ncbi:MAG: D-lyxose/D-mannose family sugar isomerase [Kiritimatiellaeota bacterium]|nr:D-lyxose/D-mannose family sugar isomerase [Kiritimatiellota bacterium]